ncbi:hypothetical protein [Mucilaginibacter sp. HD30]
MHFKFKRLFYFFVIPVLSLMVICLPSQAQHLSGGMNADGNLLGGSKRGSGGAYLPTEGWSLAANGGIEAPLGDLRDSYKSAPTFGLTLSKKTNHFILSLTTDYRAYQPKQISYPIEVEFNGQVIAAGEIGISNFTGVGAYLGAAYEWLITPSASFYAGLNGGYMFSKYSFTTETLQDITVTSQTNNIPFLGPKLGLNFAVTNRINVGIEARYSVSLAKTKVDEFFDAPITPDFKAYAGNLFLIYNF